MNCTLKTSEQEERLLDYTSGLMDSDAARSYQTHLFSCQKCRELVALHQMLDSSLDDWKAPEVSADFDAKLMAQIRAMDATPSWTERFFGGWRWTATAIPAMALAMTVYFWPTPQAPTVEMLQAHELVEVERALDDLEALQALHQTDSDKKPDSAKEIL